MTISATLKDHHATDPVILNLIGKVPSGQFKAYVEIFDACIYSEIKSAKYNAVEYSILDYPRDIKFSPFQVFYQG